MKHSNHEQRNTFALLRSFQHSFTRSEVKIADYILSNPETIIYLSVTELAELVNVGEATVLRCCRKLGFKGFQDFKLSLAQDLVQPISYLSEKVTEQDDTAGRIRKLATNYQQTIEETCHLCQPQDIEQTAALLLKARAIHFFAVGSSGISAMQAMQTFSRIGLPTNFTSDSHFQAMASSLLTKDDLAIGISVSGSSKDTVNSLTLAKEKGASVIGITHNARSPITKVADTVLLISSKENPLQGSSLAAQVSTMLLFDLLYLQVGFQIKNQAVTNRELTAKAVSDKMY